MSVHLVRIVGLVFPLFFVAYAHSGFYTLAWREVVGAYQVTVLEDFHATRANGGDAQLFVQLSDGASDGEEAAPADTQVRAVIWLSGEVVYEGEVPFIAEGSTGRTSYQGYLLALPLKTEGVYEVEVNVSGSLGAASARYAVPSQRENSALEYLPSALILLISCGGLALLFLPIKRKDAPHETSAQPLYPHKF